MIVSFLVAGCNRSAPGVPSFDLSQSNSYGVVEFKDDAPSNTDLSNVDFPLSFVALDGKPVDLTQYRGKQKVVLVVLRGMPQNPGGTFCPSCLAQTSTILANRPKFAERATAVLIVYPGSSERVGEFLAKAQSQTIGEPAPFFPLLLDQECVACSRLGIRDDLAKPSTYILDTNGKLVYAYVGQTSTDRPSIKAIVGQLDKAR